MLDMAQVNEIDASVARDDLPSGSVPDVSGRGREGSDGEAMFSVLVVLLAQGNGSS